MIHTIKQNRHGIPFGVYTSGRTASDLPIAELAEIGLSNVQVTLLAADPMSYGKQMGIEDTSQASKAFGDVCNFIVTASESGNFPVSVGILDNNQKNATSELAKALGAVDVVLYDI